MPNNSSNNLLQRTHQEPNNGVTPGLQATVQACIEVEPQENAFRESGRSNGLHITVMGN
jgi:hypothetical protein